MTVSIAGFSGLNIIDERDKFARCETCGWRQLAETLDRRCAIFTELPPHSAFPRRRESFFSSRRAHGLIDNPELMAPEALRVMRLPGHDLADNAFYARALANDGNDLASGHCSDPRGHSHGLDWGEHLHEAAVGKPGVGWFR